MSTTGETGSWVALGRVEELRGPGPFPLQAGTDELVVVRAGDGFRAFEGRCPHQGALLGEGEIVGDELVCRNHRWRFEAATGRRRGGPECLRSCPLEVRDGQLHARPDSLAVAAAATGGLRRPSQLPGPTRVPVIGSLSTLDLEKLHRTLERWSARYGQVFRCQVGPLQLVVVSDPTLIQRAFRERPSVYRRLGNIEPVFRELGIDGVFSAEGVEWRPLRRLAMEALSPAHLRRFYPTLRRVAERLARRWARAAEAGRIVDPEEDFKRFTVDVTTQLALGHDLDTLEAEGDDVLQRRLEHVFPGITRRLFATVPLWRLVKLPVERRLEAAVADVFRLLRELLAQARTRLAARPAGPHAPATFLEAMLLARDEEGRPYADAQILGNAVEMLLAGEDTTALTLSWALHELSDAPEVVRALQEEADHVLGGAPAPPDFEAAARLEVAGAVAQETMRLRPVAPLVILETNVATVLGDLELPAGQRVCLLTRLPGLSPDRFGDPGAFRPARWLAPEGPHDPAALMPFGSGPRLCPGRTLALLEMRVALATLARGFDLARVGERARVSERFAFTMGPRNLRVRLLPRRTASAQLAGGA